MELKGDGAYALDMTSRLHDDDPYAGNSADDPDRVIPETIEDATVSDGVLRSLLPPLSWNVFRLSPTA